MVDMVKDLADGLALSPADYTHIWNAAVHDTLQSCSSYPCPQPMAPNAGSALAGALAGILCMHVCWGLLTDCDHCALMTGNNALHAIVPVMCMHQIPKPVR